MEKPAASTEPQGSRPALGRESVQVPDDQDFRSFRSECEAEVGWNLTYSKAGVSVWVQAVEMDRTLHKIKCRMECCDVPAETLYDVLHDIEYRKKWDSNVIETFDIARLTVNADVGYYSCEQAQNETPTPSPSTPTSQHISSNSPSLWSLLC